MCAISAGKLGVFRCTEKHAESVAYRADLLHSSAFPTGTFGTQIKGRPNSHVRDIGTGEYGRCFRLSRRWTICAIADCFSRSSPVKWLGVSKLLYPPVSR